MFEATSVVVELAGRCIDGCSSLSLSHENWARWTGSEDVELAAVKPHWFGCRSDVVTSEEYVPVCESVEVEALAVALTVHDGEISYCYVGPCPVSPLCTGGCDLDSDWCDIVERTGCAAVCAYSAGVCDCPWYCVMSDAVSPADVLVCVAWLSVSPLWYSVVWY